MAACAVCVRDGRVLLARLVAADGNKRWTLPGGGMDHGEDPYDTVIREVEEETGYAVEPVALLGVDSIRRSYPRRLGTAADFQGLRIVYEARVTGGQLRHETGGSTDMAAWHPPPLPEGRGGTPRRGARVGAGRARRCGARALAGAAGGRAYGGAAGVREVGSVPRK